ncbi:late expression factor 5 [Epinotia aporema granulovirus]|uniref:Late expression factor 5 n=1 Tax=Epinotia aporema granulovirus TaxID=166056 RepID=K4EQE9_9BBAC|nr:late expression factor 5 [Epinotia aporema granulovirus]AER41508.1 late expression factor 5 [Epinotia aporema granulovirus]
MIVKEQNMFLDQRPIVAQDQPIHLNEIYNIFKDFRSREDNEGLIDYLVTHYPKNVKNRTFNFNSTSHVFHMLYAYVPSLSTKERKQIRLDGIGDILLKTNNDFKMYGDIIDQLMDSEMRKVVCPCELIAARLKDNIDYNKSLESKNFDTKPIKFKKEPIDNILYKYSINWKVSLNKKKCIVKKLRKSADKCAENNIPLIAPTRCAPSTLSHINGYTIKHCLHKFVVEEKQIRAGDEIVSFVKTCILCNCTE